MNARQRQTPYGMHVGRTQQYPLISSSSQQQRYNNSMIVAHNEHNRQFVCAMCLFILLLLF
jgi:hypothetical protein